MTDHTTGTPMARPFNVPFDRWYMMPEALKRQLTVLEALAIFVVYEQPGSPYGPPVARQVSKAFEVFADA